MFSHEECTCIYLIIITIKIISLKSIVSLVSELETLNLKCNLGKMQGSNYLQSNQFSLANNFHVETIKYLINKIYTHISNLKGLFYIKV